MIYASTVDLDEAYSVARKAVEVAVQDGTGYMATILRAPEAIYRPVYDKVPLPTVANSEREFPSPWISASRTDVSDDFVRYARPLIGEDWPSIPLIDGLQRFTQFSPLFADKVLAPYTPCGHR
jgi:6-phosphofructokinase 1